VFLYEPVLIIYVINIYSLPIVLFFSLRQSGGFLRITLNDCYPKCSKLDTLSAPLGGLIVDFLKTSSDSIGEI
jgi:hypothetical protein